ncbi:MAG TPA: Gfo/Idh/MocA family oxidoreductase [Limnochordia bacterium]|nr:Gfo/Idh/MocA family oxidoreductase [Limnochordia bacterium]
MRRIRVGVVGLGQIAQIMHLPYLNSTPGFELSAVCDVSPALLDGVGEQYRVPERYTDVREMIAKAPLDAILIATSFDHADIALAAIARGLHVFVEKPLCESPGTAKEIAAAADKAGVKVMVGYMKRYDPGYLRWQREVQQLSDIRLLRVHDFCHDNNQVVHDAYHLVRGGDLPAETVQAGWGRMAQRQREALGGEPAPHIVSGYGLMLGLGVHDVTILRGTVGEPKGVLFADVAVEAPHVTLAVLDYGAFRCVWEIGNTQTKHFDEELAVWAGKSILHLRFASPYLKNAPTELTITRTEGVETSHQSIIASYSEAFQNELIHFRDCVFEDRRPLTDAWEGARDIELLLEIVQRAR